MNSMVSALLFFFTQALDRPDLARRLVRTGHVRKLPVVLSQDEVARLLAATTCLKHQAALSVAYGSGLRASEVTALKVRDIDSERMLLRVERGKGGQYRNAMLPAGLLALLRAWWKAGRQLGVMHPDGWLFPGQHYLKPLSARQLHRVVVEAGRAAGLDKRIGPHTLRHCFATPARRRCRRAYHPGAARTCPARHHSLLHQGRDPHDVRRDQSARQADVEHPQESPPG
jgi:integrase